MPHEESKYPAQAGRPDANLPGAATFLFNSSFAAGTDPSVENGKVAARIHWELPAADIGPEDTDDATGRRDDCAMPVVAG